MAGIIVFREARSKKGIVRFGSLGFSNCFTILILMIRFSFWETRKVKEEDYELAGKLKERGYSIHKKDTKRKMIFVPLYSMIYLILVVLILELIEESL